MTELNRRRWLQAAGASLALGAMSGCQGKKPEVKKSKPATVKKKPQARPKIIPPRKDHVQELMTQNFVEPLRQDINLSRGDRAKILDAIALRTNETLNALVDKFSVRKAQAPFKNTYVKLQQEAMQSLLTEMVTLLRQFNYIQGDNFEKLIDSGYVYNQNFIEMLNRGQFGIPEDYKLNNDDKDIELFSKITAKGSFDLTSSPKLMELFKDLGLVSETSKTKIPYSTIESSGVSFLGLNYKGRVILNLSKIKTKAKEEKKSARQLMLAILANEISHKLVKDKYGANGISTQLDEFISDLATAYIDSEQIIHDRLDVDRNSTYVLSRNTIFDTVMDLIEEKQDKKLMRQVYAQQGRDFIEAELKRAYPDDSYTTEFIPEFQKRLKQKAISMLPQTAK